MPAQVSAKVVTLVPPDIIQLVSGSRYVVVRALAYVSLSKGETS